MPCGSLLSGGGVHQESVDAKKENKDESKNKKGKVIFWNFFLEGVISLSKIYVANYP